MAKKRIKWFEEIEKPILGLAPMHQVSKSPLRILCRRAGADAVFSEMIAGEAVIRRIPQAFEIAQFSKQERPIIIQIFGANPDSMAAAVKIIQTKFKPDGIDINMGCPDRSIEKQGCGSAMIKTPEVAKQIIAAAKRGAKSDAGGIPVSVKTRLGYNEDQVEEWIPEILSVRPAALSVHCRTRKEMSKVPARWERLERVVALRDQLSPETRIIGNGDVLSLEDAYAKIAATGADGAMVGRALFGNPWFFHPTHRLPLAQHTLPTSGVDRESLYNQLVPAEGMSFVTLVERLEALVEHTKLFTELLPHKHFAVMKKHYKGYIHSFPKASELRQTLMAADTPTDVERVVHAFLKSHPGVA